MAKIPLSKIPRIAMLERHRDRWRTMAILQRYKALYLTAEVHKWKRIAYATMAAKLLLVLVLMVLVALILEG